MVERGVGLVKKKRRIAFSVFFFNDTATTEIYTLSLHDALPIWRISKNMEEKYLKRFESFQRSLDALAEARERDMTDSFVLSGTSAKFSIT